jgi:uncharacterized membrane protein YkoI
MTLSRLVLTIGLTAMLATPALARHGDDDDDDRRSRYSDDNSQRHGSGHHHDDDDDDRDHCSTAPRSSWLSISRIEAQARSMGYTVTKIERKGTCYEVYARKDGSHHELYFDPATGKVVRWEQY